MKTQEREFPVRVRVVRERLGVGQTYMTELLKAVGLPGKKIIFESTVINFLKQNPGWKIPPQTKRAQ